MFRKVLVANRGEIAIRVFRTLRELDIASVAVYSEADRASLHVGAADEAYLVGPGPAAESYLVQERLIETAITAGAEAIHPGYGFLAENARFARAVEQAGLVWIGPPPEAIELMGSKVAARELMRAAGVPIVPGTTEPVEAAEDVARLGDEYGWPIAIKAAAGGGGKGFKVVSDAAEAERAFQSARREGEAYFSDPTVYVEKYIEDPRHVEVQVLADAHGTVLHLGERDCTIQRRHQKLIEESPSPAVSAELRERIGRVAVDAARAAGYRSAGTIEGLLDPAGNYFFLEMNTRIQVEHTVTEMVTGVDLVREQVRIAAGEPLSFAQEEVRVAGHAIECRINAEDPSSGFLPTPGVITRYREPAGPGVRVDSGVVEGAEVIGLYDPLIAKLIVWDRDRERARRRMLRALSEYAIEGVSTLVGFHRALLSHPHFVEGATCRGLVESKEIAERARELAAGGVPAVAEPGRTRDRVVVAEVDGRRFRVRLHVPEPAFAELARRRRERASTGTTGATSEAVVSPMQGTVLAVEVSDGDTVIEGQVICVIEAMKMENELTAHRTGLVTGLSVRAGEAVRTGQVICVVSPDGGPGRSPAGSDPGV
ncbi:MAG: acetyl-CoA carboxylase biotin carboxylase subunit [Thermoleophilia bacterium]|nr:acetyl-CoA carboxylase biotin carboxylase subunit [Thermoleophilia bacterium]